MCVSFVAQPMQMELAISFSVFVPLPVDPALTAAALAATSLVQGMAKTVIPVTPYLDERNTHDREIVAANMARCILGGAVHLAEGLDTFPAGGNIIGVAGSPRVVINLTAVRGGGAGDGK